MQVSQRTRRGIAVLIIYTDFDFPKKSERRSALNDYENMQEMFQHLNFDIKLILNEPPAALFQKLKGIRDELKNSDDSFVCMISTHGEEVPRSDSHIREHILYTNNGSVKTEDVLGMFNDKNCRCLKGNPRLFIIQSCRTVFKSTSKNDELRSWTKVNVLRYEENDSNVRNERISKSDARPFISRKEDSDTNSRLELDICSIPCYNDFVVVFSSASGHISWSEDREGGWLPYCLFKTFRDKIDNEENMDVISLLTEAAGRVSRDMESNNSSEDMSGAKSCIVVYHRLRQEFIL